jgi:hypothetical protein
MPTRKKSHEGDRYELFLANKDFANLTHRILEDLLRKKIGLGCSRIGLLKIVCVGIDLAHE